MTEWESDHAAWLEQLSDYIDGSLSREREAAVTDHLASCPRCAAVLGELRHVAAEAARWNQPSDPVDDLWPGIEARLKPRPWWTRQVFSLPAWLPVGWPRLAAAAAVCLVLLVGSWAMFASWYGGHRESPTERVAVDAQPELGPEPGYLKDVARLQREAADRLAKDPHLVTVLEENLASIDVAIANYRDALQQAPDDDRLRHRLQETRERKVRILRDAVALASESGN